MAEDFLPQENSRSEQSSSSRSDSDRERVKHLLVGSPRVVTRTIHYLHLLGYAEVREWSRPVSAGELGNPTDVVCVLIRYVLSE